MKRRMYRWEFRGVALMVVWSPRLKKVYLVWHNDFRGFHFGRLGGLWLTPRKP